MYLVLQIGRRLLPAVPLNVPRVPCQAFGGVYDVDNLLPHFGRRKRYPQRLREGQTNRWAIRPLRVVVRVQTGSAAKHPIEGAHRIYDVTIRKNSLEAENERQSYRSWAVR
jgi:hypothetical protein